MLHLLHTFTIRMYADEQPTRIGLTTKLHMLTKSHHALLYLSQVVCDTTSCAKTCRVPICPVVAPGCKMGKIKYDKCGCQKGCPKQKCKEKCRNISCRQYKCAGPGAGCKVGKLKYDECGCQQGCPKLTCPSQKVGAWFCAGNQAPGPTPGLSFPKRHATTWFVMHDQGCAAVLLTRRLALSEIPSIAAGASRL